MPSNPIHLITDEEQSRWLVTTNDPAFSACEQLAATFSQIVLPRSYIIRGSGGLIASSELAGGIKKVERAWANTEDEDLRLEYLHRVRLFDCLYVLERRGAGGGEEE